MTEPGPLERMPTKVVPYVVTGYAEEDVPQQPDEELPQDAPEPRARRRGQWFGFVALGLAVATVITHVVATVIASANDFEPATTIAYVAIGLSAASVVCGIVSVALGLGRAWGVIAIVLGLIANPFLLLWVLRGASVLVTG